MGGHKRPHTGSDRPLPFGNVQTHALLEEIKKWSRPQQLHFGKVSRGTEVWFLLVFQSVWPKYHLCADVVLWAPHTELTMMNCINHLHLVRTLNCEHRCNHENIKMIYININQYSELSSYLNVSFLTRLLCVYFFNHVSSQLGFRAVKRENMKLGRI